MLIAQARDYAERRDFIRMFVDAKVVIIDENSGKEYLGEARNLSGRGLMFEADVEPTVGDNLKVVVSSNQSRMPPLQAAFKVARVQKLKIGRYEVAGELSDVN